MNTPREMRLIELRGFACWSLLIASTLGSSCAPVEDAAMPEPEVVASKEQPLEFLVVLDAIGKIYGAYQAGQFLYNLAVGPAEDAAVAALRDYRNGELVGITNGLIANVNEILSNPSLAVATGRLAQVLNDSNVLEGRLIAAINGGNVNDAHQLAPALNLIAPIHAHMLAYAGYGVNERNALFAKVLQANFQMVGAWITSRVDPGLSAYATERDHAVLWSSDGGSTIYQCPTNLLPPFVLGAACTAFGCWSTAGHAGAVDAPLCRTRVYRLNNKIYNRNQVVKMIEAAMARIIGMGVDTVNAYDGSTIRVIDPIGREGAIALVGGAGWWSVPVGFSNGDGSFTVANSIFPGSDSFATFPVRASQRYEIPLSGDVASANPATIGLADGRSDIILAGRDPFLSIATARGDGSFGDGTYSFGDSNFSIWQLKLGAHPVGGDFNGDGKMDVALVGGADWTSVPISFAPTNGVAGAVTNTTVANFPTWAQVSGAKPVAGDFNGDGRTDIALTGGAGWTSVPVAFSKGDGSFNVSNSNVTDFPTWAQAGGAKPVAGDFDGDGRTDIALVGGPGWYTLPIAFSNGNGSFRVTNTAIADFSSWAEVSGAMPVAGDFDGDGRTDIALTGGTGWWTIPVAFSNADGSFRVTNEFVADLPTWATTSGVTPVGGVFR